MTLSAEVFDQIVKCLRSDRSTTQHEQRASPRVGLRAQADVLLKPGSRTPPVPECACATCRSGASACCTRARWLRAPNSSCSCPTGAPRPATGAPRSCTSPAWSRHCRELAADTYTVGGRIVRVLSAEEAAMIVPPRK